MLIASSKYCSIEFPISMMKFSLRLIWNVLMESFVKPHAIVQFKPTNSSKPYLVAQSICLDTKISACLISTPCVFSFLLINPLETVMKIELVESIKGTQTMNELSVSIMSIFYELSIILYFGYNYSCCARHSFKCVMLLIR